MRVGLSASPYTKSGVDLIVGADSLGVDSVWVAESWGYDAFTPLGYALAESSGP